MSDKQNRQPQTTVDTFQQFQNRTAVADQARWWLHRTATPFDWLIAGNRDIAVLTAGKICWIVVSAAKTD